jgi:transmembrane sensor
VSSDRTEEIEAAASNWLVYRESGRWTQTDQTRFEQWLDASTLNRVAFLRLELAWEDAARLKALGAGVPSDHPPTLGQWNLTPFFVAQHAPAQHTPAPRSAPGRAVRRARGLALAASILLAVTVGVGEHERWGGSGDRYATPVGGITSVPLRDGSNITLNTDSQVRVALSGTERHIELKQGEAFFEVARDPNRPFVVEAGKQRIIAVGTKFSVQRNGDSVEVVVTEGKVRVEDARRPLRKSTTEAAGGTAPRGATDPVFLTAGAIALADEAGVLVERKSLEEAETHLSWRNGVLIFRDLSLADAVAEFNRYNARKIEIADPAVAALKVEGNFRATNAQAFVRLLADYFPIRVAAREDRIVLSAK